LSSIASNVAVELAATLNAKLGTRCMSGLLHCRAPELLLGSTKYGAEVDVWSTGCIFFELLTGITPFKAENEVDMLSAIMHVLGKPSWLASEGIPAASSLKQCVVHS